MSELIFSCDNIYWYGEFRSGTIIKSQNNVSFEKGTYKSKKLQGWICPGLVNAHCHLEFSHLGKCSQEIKGQGMAQFILWIQKIRNQSLENLEQSTENVLTNFQEEGTFFIADICNSLNTQKIKEKFTKIYFQNFWEVFGLNPEISKNKWLEIQKNAKKINALITLHAPYSCSLELIHKVNSYNTFLQSIHLAESKEELEYFQNHDRKLKNAFIDMGINPTFLVKKLPYSEAILSEKVQNYLLVHNVFLDEKKIPNNILKNCYFCICLTSNIFLHNQTVSLAFIKKLKNKICLGTDSLATNDQLSILKEMNYLRNLGIETNDIVNMSTIHGYQALKIPEHKLQAYHNVVWIYEKQDQFNTKVLW